MSSIFISHSSKDKSFASKVSVFLNQTGHKSVFLDFDPEYGIPAGRNWEKELYKRLSNCQAIIVLCSKDFNLSSWCFAEITHGKALGKYIIPIKIDDCVIHSILKDVQVIDATSSLDEAFRRLEKSLDIAGINKAVWDNARPPYPGLLAFQEADASIFFGRQEETESLLKTLRQFRSFGGPKLLLVLGASGSGKSSLIRAGVIPQLRKDTKSWIIIGPFRPLKSPFEELSKAIANTFQKFQHNKQWEDVYYSLIKDANTPESSGKTLISLSTELTALSNQSDITLLFFIDQFEELLPDINKKVKEAEQSTEELFLSWLRNFLESSDNKILIIGTLRSDFLGNFQNASSLRGLTFNDYILKSVGQEGLRASITEPAKVAGLELEDGLAESMLDDTETPDALPLLAFTLRELWEQYGNDGLLTTDEYKNKLGGMEGSIAKVAEAVLLTHIVQTGNGWLVKSENNENRAKLDPDDEQQLKTAFMSMVRIDEEGKYTKRFADMEELPEKMNKLLQSFVSCRLLTTSGDGKNIKIEVAHEAIFRTWTRLVKWLEDDRNFLLWRKKLNIGQEEWEASNRNESELLRGPALGEAIGWLNLHKTKKYNLTTKEIEFIDASYKESEKQRLRKQRQLRLLSAAAVAVIIIIGILYYKNYKTNIQIQNQLARNYWNYSEAARSSNNLPGALLYIAEAISSSRDADLTENLFIDSKDLVSEIWMKEAVFSHKGINGAILHPSGNKILSWGEDGAVRLWDVVTGNELGPTMKHNSEVIGASFNKDGKLILTYSKDGSVRLWSVETNKQIGSSMKHDGPLDGAVLNRYENRILSWGSDSTVRLWNAINSQQIDSSINLHGHIFQVQFSPDEKQILTASGGDGLKLWNIETGRLIPFLKAYHSRIPVSFSHNGNYILTSDWLDTVSLLNTETGEEMRSMRHDNVTLALFSHDSKLILSCGQDSTIRLWETETGKQVGINMTHNEMTGAVFNQDSKQILTWGFDNTARLWDANTGRQLGDSMAHNDILEGAAFSPDEKRILTWGDDQTARIWEAGTGKLVSLPLQHDEDVEYAGFSRDGKQILTWCRDGSICLWRAGDNEESADIFLTHHNVRGAVFNNGEKQILTWGGDAARLWDANTYLQMDSFKHAIRVTGAKFSGDGNQILTWGDTTVRLWNAKTGELLAAMNHEAMVTTAEFISEKIVTYGIDETLRVWELQPVIQTVSIKKFPRDFNGIFSSNGKRIITTSDDGSTFRIWDIETGKQLGDSIKMEFPTHGIATSKSGALFSRDQKQLLTWGYGHSVQLRESSTGRQSGSTMLHDENVEGAIFSPNEGHILTWSQDRTARLWKTGSGEQIGPSMNHDEAVWGAVFANDGKMILTWDYGGQAKLWEVGTGKEVNISGLKNTGIRGAVFGDLQAQILAWDRDKIHIWKIKGDFDIPTELFKLQAIVVTGINLNTDANVIKPVPPDQWFKLKDDYLKKASEHYKVCKYPQHNLWKRFFPKEAKEIRP